jgi:hypothetical protein
MNSTDLLIGCFVIYVLGCFVVILALCKRIDQWRAYARELEVSRKAKTGICCSDPAAMAGSRG